MEITSIIIKPKLTEKTQKMRSSSNPVMTFVVNKKANKYQVSAAFQALFGIRPERVNIINRKGSPARITNKSRHNYHKSFKLALVKVNSQDFSNLQQSALKETEEKSEQAKENGN